MTKPIFKIAVFLAVVFVIFILLYISAKVPSSAKTDRMSYNKSEPLKVKISNRDGQEACFSSCFPFYIELKDVDNLWKKIDYSNCLEENRAENCMKANSKKLFEFALSNLLQKGDYRLAIPLCLSCQNGNDFKEEKWIYSNKFKIKQ